MMHDPMMPLDDDRLSTTSSKIPLVNHAQYIPLGYDAQYDKMSELRRSPHHVHPAQLLSNSEYRKHLEHFEFDQGNTEDDRVEHIHETNFMEDLGQELNDRTGAQRRSPAQRSQGRRARFCVQRTSPHTPHGALGFLQLPSTCFCK